MIVLEPQAGLANRLRAIDSGIALSSYLKMPLRIDWIMNKDLNCPFNKLFKPINTIEKIDSVRLPFPYNFSGKLHFWKKKQQFSVAFNSNQSKSISKQLAYLKGLKENQNIYISSCHFFFDSPRNYRYLQPIDEITQKVNQVTSAYAKNCIGLHIRRTDHTVSISSSPSSAFISTIKKEILSDPSTTFFLATDSIAEEEMLTSMFPNRIITYPKELSRTTEKGVQDALVDMLCLSKTRKVYGSNQSSFSGAATYFTGIELCILHE